MKEQVKENLLLCAWGLGFSICWFLMIVLVARGFYPEWVKLGIELVVDNLPAPKMVRLAVLPFLWLCVTAGVALLIEVVCYVLGRKLYRLLKKSLTRTKE